MTLAPSFRGDEGRSLLPDGFPVVLESDDAGRFYCAHALFVGHLAAERGRAPFARDSEHEPLLGFLHVPPDAATSDARRTPPADRHRDTRIVVAAALAGYAATLLAAPASPRAPQLLVTGFGAFRDVIDNPTGRFVQSSDDVRRTLELAFGDALETLEEREGLWRAALRAPSGRALTVRLESLSVDDSCLSFTRQPSLLTLLEDGANAWLGLGVARSKHFRVETLPHDGGLRLDDDGAYHDPTLEPRRFPSPSRALVRAIERGGRLLASRRSS